MPELTDAELAARLRLALARLSRRLRAQVPQSLTYSQVTALATVEELEPIRLSDLALTEGVSVPTLSRLVAGLEKEMLIVRKPDPVDGRAAQLHITDLGRERLEALRTERSAYLVQRLEALPEDKRTALAGALDALESLARSERCDAE